MRHRLPKTTARIRRQAGAYLNRLARFGVSPSKRVNNRRARRRKGRGVLVPEIIPVAKLVPEKVKWTVFAAGGKLFAKEFTKSEARAAVKKKLELDGCRIGGWCTVVRGKA